MRRKDMYLLFLGVFPFLGILARGAETECQDQVYDIYFVADKSISITDKELDMERTVIRHIIAGLDLGVNKTRVGMIAFSNDTEHVFGLGEYNEHTDYDIVELVPRPVKKYGTETHKGLRLMRQKFKSEGRSEQGVKQIGVVLSDGKSTSPGPLKVTANQIHAANLTVLVIGIGTYVDINELQMIATGSDSDNVFFAKNFEALDGMTLELTKEICRAPNRPQDRASCPSICLENGSVSGTEKAGETVTLACDEGFRLTGSSEVTCMTSGKWSEKIPRCAKETYCSHRVGIGIANGKAVYTNTRLNAEGGQVSFSCDDGYDLVGNASIKCVNGKWNGGGAKCIFSGCKSITRIMRGRVKSQQITRGGKASFACDEGNTMIGQSTITCKGKGIWTSRIPKCTTSKSCSLPTFFKNGKASHSGRVSAGMSVSLSCQPGYSLRGAANITCTVRGAWSSKFPICRRSRCRWLPGIRNGVVTRKESNGDVLQMYFTCNKGYTLNGHDTLTCGGNAEWDHPVPNCRYSEKSCRPIGLFENGHVENYNNSMGSVITIVCNHGWFLADGKENVTCRANGKWSSYIPNCKRNLTIAKPDTKCPQMVDISRHGRCVGDHKRYSRVRCSCDAGYRLTTPSVLKCKSHSNGTVKWSTQKQPSCQYSRCPQLPMIANGRTNTQDNDEGVRVTFTCDPSYTLIGQSRISCLNNKWSHPQPTCQLKRCLNILNIKNAHVHNVSSGEEQGSIRRITCFQNYNLVGKFKIVCVNGKWTPSLPRCTQIKRCPVIESVRNGKIQGSSFSVGATLKVNCDYGFSAVGPSSVTCQSNKQWSGTLECRRILCPTINTVPNAKFLQFSNGVGSRVEMVCDKGFLRKGRGSMFCNKNGTWSGTVPYCLKKEICPVMCVKNGRAIYPSRESRGLALFACREGYRLSGPATVSCSDGVWAADPPKCIPLPKPCITRMDLMLIVDSSYPHTWETLESVVKELSSHFKIGGGRGRIGVIAYTKSADVIVPLNQHKSNKDFINADIFKNVSRNSTGHNLLSAIELLPSVYDKPGRVKAAIFIASCYFQMNDELRKSVNAAKYAGIQFYSISTAARNNITNLQSIVSGNATDNLFKFPSIDDFFIGDNSSRVAGQICGAHVDSPPQIKTVATEVCRERPLDIYFVVDTSKSIGPNELKAESRAMKYIINNFDIGVNKTRIGLITFNRNVQTVFNLTRHQSKESLNTDELLEKRNITRGGTRTDLGLEEVMRNFAAEEMAGRDKVVILMTDGKATASVTEVAEKLHTDTINVKVIAVGIGKQTDMKEIKLLASGKGRENVFTVQTFADLTSLDGVIALRACT